MGNTLSGIRGVAERALGLYASEPSGIDTYVNNRERTYVAHHA